MSIEIIDLITKDDIAIHLPSREAMQKNALLIFNHLARPTMDDLSGLCRTFQSSQHNQSLETVEKSAGCFLFTNVET
jgi:hypothetical protein